MKYSIQKILELIDAEKNKDDYYFYLSKGGYGVDYYVNLITDYHPNESVIIRADCHKPKIYNKNIKFQEIDIDNILIYEYIGHNEDYTITQLDSLEKAIHILLGNCGLLNIFTGDIIVLEDGKRKNYYVRDTNGKILHWEDIEQIKKLELALYIDWY